MNDMPTIRCTGECLDAELEEEDLSDAALAGNEPERSPGDSAMDAPCLPPPEPPPLAPGEEARLVGMTTLGDTVDLETGEVLQDAPGYDPVTRTILNNEGCDWAGGRLREKRDAIDECHRMYDAEVQRIQAQCDRLMAAADERLNRATAPLRRDEDFLENVIRVYANGHRADILSGLRTKSRTFPSGLRVAWKKSGGEYRWRQDMSKAVREAALLKWTRAKHPVYIRQEPVVATGLLKRDLLVLRNSDAPPPETPPGLEWVPEGETVSVSVDSKEEKP